MRMEYTTLGRTELKVSVADLGCGGFSRLGLNTGGTEASAGDYQGCAEIFGLIRLR